MQDDFLPTMQTLLKRADSLDGIVAETSGLALPRPLPQALEWPEVRAQVVVNGVITVVMVKPWRVAVRWAIRRP